MMDKRSRKLASVRKDLPAACEWGDETSKIGIVATGILQGVITEALTRLEDENLKFHCHRPRTLWPLPQETVDFINAHDRVYVIEQSEGAQLAGLLRSEGADAGRIRSILKYDGLQFTSGELVAAILKRERMA